MVDFEYEDTNQSEPIGTARAFYILLISLLGFVLWLVAGAILTKAFIRNQSTFFAFSPTVHAKMLGFESAKDNLETVFIGSSRTHRQIDPFWIETTMSEMGCGTGSVYNFGVGGLSSSSIRFLLDYGLRTRPEVKRFWVEPWGVDQWTTRTSTVNYALAPVWPYPIWKDRYTIPKDEMSLGQNKNLILFQLSTMSLFNFGIFHSMLESPGLNPNFDELSFQGYKPLDEKFRPQDKRRRDYTRRMEINPNYFKEALTSAGRTIAKERTLSQGSSFERGVNVFLDGLSASDLQRVGISLVPKNPSSQQTENHVIVNGVSIPVISTPLSEFDWLGDGANYIDLGHLDRRSSTKLSKLLALQICELSTLREDE